MDSPEQTKRLPKPLHTGRALLLSALLALAALPVLSGCTEQEARIQNPDTALLGEPVVDERLTQQDFGFPSQTPSLKRGREIFQQQCVKCHAASYWQTQKVKEDLAYTTPIDTYLMLTTGQAPEVVLPTAQRKQLLPAKHPSIREQVNRDDRWAVIFYARYLAGAGDIQAPGGGGREVMQSQVFGGNCAVCHGNRGQADGPLHIGKTGNHELHDGELRNALLPAPANFTQYSRMYNRTDAQLFKYICQGIYPSAMPSWYGAVERDKDTGKTVYVFDDKLIWNLVRHVRTFAYNNDLNDAGPAPAGLQQLQPCPPVPQNRPWTQQMVQNAPKGGPAYKSQPGNKVTGGMTFQSIQGVTPVIRPDQGDEPSTIGPRSGL